MAEVKLDISEYELMKENARLLEESLAREKKLSDENSILQKEKIAALKKNSKQVTIVKRVNRHTIIQQLNTSEDIARYLESRMRLAVMNTIARILGEIGSHDVDRFMIDSRRGVDLFHEMRRRYTNPKTVDYLLECACAELQFSPQDVKGIFYKELDSQESWDDDVITITGLDQVKADIEAKVKSELDLEAKMAIEENPRLLKRAAFAESKFKSQKKSIKTLKEINDDKTKEITQLGKKYLDLQESTNNNSWKIADISLVVSDKITKFGNKKRLEEIKAIIDKKEENNERFL